MNPSNDSQILCVGEVLWDSLPSGLFLGGAPFNVACDLHALKHTVKMLGRVGHDVLGKEALRRMKSKGMCVDLIQVDDKLPTGFVQVDVNEQGAPRYTIAEPAAWDAVSATREVIEELNRTKVLVFGSLAQRSTVTRGTIQALCSGNCLKVFDVNLRPPYDDREIVRASLRRTNVLKLNFDEMRQIAGWFGLPQDEQSFCDEIGEQFGCETVCITKGARGAVLWASGRCYEHPGFEVIVRDAVGAGDAFLAGFVSGYLAQMGWEYVLEHANLLGAYVASVAGATPAFDFEGLTQFRRQLGSRYLQMRSP